MKALIIIDMQKGCFSPYSDSHDTLGVISRINSLADKFRQKNYPVIFIQHDGTSEGELIPQTDEWSLLPELTALGTDVYIGKTAQDAFYNTTLQNYLSVLGISELFIAGSSTDFCVDTTIKSAYSKDYKVTVVSDCHTVRDRQNLKAETIIRYFNWIWSDMAPTKYKISVIEASRIDIN